MKAVFCAHCGSSKFGLVRQRWLRLVFCSIPCKEKYLAKLKADRDRLSNWLGYLAWEPTKR
jgi:hypothetical protein